jgi:short subunit dehydrogenase-like uncharacterized protein
MRFCSAMSQKSYDILVYGATGFTGKQAAHYLDRHAPPGLRLAIAGRNRGKLEELAGELSRRDVGIVVADASVPTAVHAMCATSRVVCSTAGPFSTYGTPVVEGCVEHRSHYCDITGETPWARDMIDRFHARAVADGTRLVPFSGYDSCPSDLGVFMIARALRQRGEDTVRVDGLHSGKGGFNGGTLATVLNMGAEGRLADAARPFLLSPGVEQPSEVVEASKDPTGVFFHTRARRYTAPFMMGEINTRVVRRSAALFAGRGLGYGPSFVYQEYFGAQGRLTAYAMSGAMVLGQKLVTSRVGRALLGRLGPKPGQGPSEQAMDGGFVKSRFFGIGSSGTEVEAEVSGPGDPGNRVTIRFLGESALALAEGSGDPGGFLTPATAFGDVLLDRVRAQGMRCCVL